MLREQVKGLDTSQFDSSSRALRSMRRMSLLVDREHSGWHVFVHGCS
jgi:hypothetical protein